MAKWKMQGECTDNDRKVMGYVSTDFEGAERNKGVERLPLLSLRGARRVTWQSRSKESEGSRRLGRRCLAMTERECGGVR